MSQENLDDALSQVASSIWGVDFTKRKLIPELVNLPPHIKEFLFNASWQVLTVRKYCADYSEFSFYNMNQECIKSGEAAYANVPLPKVKLTEEIAGTLYGFSKDIMKTNIDGIDISNTKSIVEFLKDYEQNIDKNSDKNLNILKELQPYNTDLDEDIKFIKNSGKIQNKFPILYTGGITDYRICEYGLTSGGSLGVNWYAFNIMKCKNKYYYIGACSSLIEFAETLIKDNPNIKIEEIEEKLEPQLKEFESYE